MRMRSKRGLVPFLSLISARRVWCGMPSFRVVQQDAVSILPGFQMLQYGIDCTFDTDIGR